MRRQVLAGWKPDEIDMLAGLAGDHPWEFLPEIYRRWAVQAGFRRRKASELLQAATDLNLSLRPVCNWLSPNDVAYFLDRAPVTIRRWVAKGLVKIRRSKQVRGPYWLSRDDLKKLAKTRPDLFGGGDPGKLFMLLEKHELADHINQNYAVCNGRKRKVQCVETGRIFPSAVAADHFMHHVKGAVSHSISNGTCSGGYHWRYVR